MDTYGCPACGGVASAEGGCRSCGRPHDPDAAALERVKKDMAALDAATSAGDIDYETTARRSRLQAERTALMRAVALKLGEEAGSGRRLRAPRQFGGRPRTPRQSAPPPAAPSRAGSPAAAPPTVDDPGAETSARGAQNTLLTLGGVLLGIAAIVFTGLYYGANSGGRAFVLAIATTLCLGIPVLLARRTLTATAETIASIGLLLVFLDGWIAYTSNLAGLAAVPPALFTAILFLLVAGVASAYRLATHLRAPQFAALLAVQPWLPLVALHLEFDRVGFAAVFALVAAANLGAVSLFSSELRLLVAADRFRTRGAPVAGLGWPRMLRELAWFLFGLSLTAATALAIVSLLDATTIGAAALAGLVLVGVAGVGAAGGLLSGRETLRQVGLGAAALAVLAATARVNVLAVPDFTLVLTAALAAGIAVAASLLPEHLRRGPQLGSLLGAVFTALVVIGQTLGIVIATVRASVTPAVWAADLVGYAERVHTADWQVPAAAILLAILSAVAVPGPWRIDAAVIGGTVAILALPGAGTVAWWVMPVLAVIASTAATGTAVYAPSGRAALIRSSAASVLGLYAVATSLSRAELTAVVCGSLALVAAGTAIVTAAWPERFGPFADRVADAAVGAAAFTLPIAVATFAWLGGATPRLLVPVTLLATALGVLGAALSQVAASEPRTVSAGGALAATIGCLVLAFTLDGAERGDLLLSGLLLGAAIATATSRAFEIPRPGPDPITRRVDAGTIGAALATAGVILAMARLCAIVVPGIGLVTTTAMVLVTALAVRALPEKWRAGPRLGGAAVGGTIAAVCAVVAIGEAGRAVAAALPFWAADLATWSATASGWTPFGWQVPISLLLAAVAAFVLLPAPQGGDIAFVAAALAGLALPATAGLPWWTPTLIAMVFATAAGLGAALVNPGDPEGTAQRRLGLAAVLGFYAAATAIATPGLTGLLLSGVVAVGVVVAAVANVRGRAPVSALDGPDGDLLTAGPVPAIVPGVAAASALAALPGAAATLAAAGGSPRGIVLGAALAVTAAGAPAVWGLRASGVHWGLSREGYDREVGGSVAWPALGVGLAALIIAGAAAAPHPVTGAWIPDAQVWAAAAALVAALAASAIRSRREASAVIASTVGPAALVAAIASAPAWLIALVGPYRTIQSVWQGYAVTPVPEGAGLAVLTLLLLTGVTASVAVTLGGGRYLLASTLPPLAALAVLLPAAVGAPRGSTAWAALAVAVVTGVGAALSPPTLPSAARLLRSTAGVICAVTGAAGIAGSLATRSGTLTALLIVVAAAGLAASAGRDPAVRMVAWTVAAAASFALPVTALAAAGRDLRPAAFGILAICGGFAAVAWYLVSPVADRPAHKIGSQDASRRARPPGRPAEAAMVELCGWLGATFALLLALGSARHTAAVLTIWGLLLGAAALRRDRSAARRTWLIRAALAAEVGACWLLLYSVEIGLPEAYTLPFAGVALLAGALELRQRPTLSSWSAYGPALAGGFLPSLALVLVDDAEVWRWVALFVAAIGVVLIGVWRRRLAPVVTGAAVAIVVALVEMIRLLLRGSVAGAILVAVAGVVLIAFGALSEQRLRRALKQMS